MFCRGSHETEDRHYVEKLQGFHTDVLYCLKVFSHANTSPVLHQYLSNTSASILLHLCKTPQSRWSFSCFASLTNGLWWWYPQWCTVTKRDSKPRYGLVWTQVLFCFRGGNLQQKNGTGWTGGGSNILKVLQPNLWEPVCLKPLHELIEREFERENSSSLLWW